MRDWSSLNITDSQNGCEWRRPHRGRQRYQERIKSCLYNIIMVYDDGDYDDDYNSCFCFKIYDDCTQGYYCMSTKLHSFPWELYLSAQCYPVYVIWFLLYINCCLNTMLLLYEHKLHRFSWELYLLDNLFLWTNLIVYYCIESWPHAFNIHVSTNTSPCIDALIWYLNL